jgi:hypothetical protein
MRSLKIIHICFFIVMASNCKTNDFTKNETSNILSGEAKNLRLSQGYLDFIDPAKLSPFLQALPKVSDQRINKVINHPNTMWYDEEAMVFVYQDSVETVTGVRHNSVGYDVGTRNRGNPQISKLRNYFQKDRFKFPFAGVAGADNVTNIKSKNFWLPPRDGVGKVIPVKWWKTSRRGRWNWVHPKGTFFGEVLYQQGPDQKWYVFEIRVREKYSEGWDVDVFRPFATSVEMAAAIRSKRTDWRSVAELKTMVDHLVDKTTLKSYTMEAPFYQKIFVPIAGSLDELPPIADYHLIASLLRDTTFKSVKGKVWKTDGVLETYAPASSSDFNIVPKGYELGMIPVNEVSCNRCHQSTGVQLGHLDSDLQLYGEIWGEDRIFTWHLFEPNKKIYSTFDEADGSRKINQRLIKAGLLEQGKPETNSQLYPLLPKQLKDRFK